MPMESRYFDWAASSIPDRKLIREGVELALEVYANPSAAHAAGVLARERLAEARMRAASALCVPPQTLFFTSGATEAAQIMLLSFLNRPGRGNILISAIEHPSVREQAALLSASGWEIRTVYPDRNGLISPEAVCRSADEHTAAVFVMAVNNEIGSIQPLTEIVHALRTRAPSGRRVWVHTDCAQAAGKIPLSLADWGVDSASFSAHKLGGAKGSGLLYAASAFTPFLRGGGQEAGMRSGTENLAGAWTLSRCLETYRLPSDGDYAARAALQYAYTQEFIEKLRDIPGCALIPHTRLGNADEPFSPWIVQASFQALPGEVLTRSLSAEGLYISTGSACSSKKKERPVLAALGIKGPAAQNAVRLSFGHATTKEDMDLLAGAIAETAGRFKSPTR